MNERITVSTSVLAASLAAYWIACAAGKDSVPFVMVGGFIGALLGEAFAGNNPEKNRNNGR